MILDLPSQPSSDYRLDHNYSNGRTSTSTEAPPPYEPNGRGTEPLLIQDEKHRHVKVNSDTTTPRPTAYTEPPPAFSRIAAVSPTTTVPFAPMTIPVDGSGKALDKGFSLGLPPSPEPVHPFQQRDISEADWTRFMQDLKNCTALCKVQQNKALLIPLALSLGPAAYCVSQAIKNKSRKEKLARAINLINTWNQHFFAARQMEVTLMRGSHALTTCRSRFVSGSPNKESLSSLSEESSGLDGKSNQAVKENSKAMKLIVASL